MFRSLRALALPDATREGRLVVGLVSASHFVHHAYLMLLPAVLTAVAATFDVSLAAVGLAVGVQGAVVAAGQLPYGYVSDSYSREAVLAASLTLGALGALLLATASSYAWLLAAAAVSGAGIAGHHPSHYPLLAAATREDARGRAFSLHGFAGSLGFAVPFGVVPVVRWAGGDWRAALAAVGVAGAAFAVACIWTLRARVSTAVRRPGDGGTASRGVRDSLRSLAAAPGIVALAVLALVTSTANWAIMTYSPVLYARAYGLAEAEASLLASAMLVVSAGLMLVGGVLADRFPAPRVMVGGFLALTGLSAALATGALPFVAFLLAALPFVGAITVSRPARSKLADALSTRGDLGKSFALITIGISGGAVVAPPTFGWVVEAMGVRTVFVVVAGLGVLAAALTLGVVRYAGPSGAPRGAPAAEADADD